MSDKTLDDFLKEGWRVEYYSGTGFYGIDLIIAPTGICYRDRVYFGELEEGYDEWNDECQDAQDFATKITHFINNGGRIEDLSSG